MLNPSQALAVRQVLDESCITALTGGAGKGKSETMVTCIKAVLWQQGLMVAQNRDPADMGTFNMGRKVGGLEEDTPPRACVLVRAPTNTQVGMLLARVHEECYKDTVFWRRCLATIRPPGCASEPNGLLPHQGWRPSTHGAARCLTIACQGLPEQRKEPLTEDSSVAAYTLGRHFANSMRVPMQDCSELLMRCSPFSLEVPHSHPGRLHEAVRVVDNAWRDDGGLGMLQQLVEEMEAAGVRPAYTQRLSPEGRPRGDPNDSTSSAVAQGVGAAVLMARDP